MTDRIQRKLAAVLAADVAGYSRLMGEDEAGTLSALRQLRTKLFAPTVNRHHGKVVKSMGDGWLVEFTSVVDAVTCAIDVQESLAAHERIHLRMGIHLGDIVHEEEDIFGDGVNIAARLQEIAEPGAIVISDIARRSIDSKLATAFVDLGVQNLKNIAEPVTAYGWGMTAIVADAKILPLPDKPSIAVLPFDNMSGDPDQEYFADGIAEDIITALSKFRWFFVISRNSTFVYKGQAVDVKQVGRELGVRYVLEGSVRKAADRVRISTQLVEAETGNHVWAERYDRRLEDIFELQDEITSTIAASVEPELAGSERERAMRKPTEHLGAWDLFQRGVALMWQHDRAGINRGIKLVQQAVELDPSFGQAYGLLAFGAFLLLVYEWADDRKEVLKKGLADASKAIAIDQRDYFALYALGRFKTLEGEHQAAVRALESCVSINPNFALGHLGLAVAHVYGGDPKKAIDYADTAVRLSPNDPMMWVMLHYKASALVRLDDFDRAIEVFEKVCEFPTVQYVPPATLAALYVIQGREAEGRKALRHALRLEPTLSISLMKKVYGLSKDRPGIRAQRLLDALRRAGMPE